MASAELYYPGDLISCNGYLRQGKTMNMVRLAWKLHQYWGMPVLCNFPVAFGTRVRFVEDYMNARGHILLWDEMQDSLDSREFKNNVEATRQAIKLGKRGNILIYTTPVFGMVDVRFRQITQWVYMAHKPKVGLTVVTRYWYPGLGDMIFPRGKLVMYHKHWGPSYDTLEEDTTVLPRPKPKENAGKAKQLSGSVSSPSLSDTAGASEAAPAVSVDTRLASRLKGLL